MQNFPSFFAFKDKGKLLTRLVKSLFAINENVSSLNSHRFRFFRFMFNRSIFSFI